jgi:hypothetical protein
MLYGIQTGSGTHQTSYAKATGSVWNVKLTTHLQLVFEVKNGAAIPPLPYLPDLVLN